MTNLLFPPEYRNKPETFGRRTGVSTVQALTAIAEAIWKPGERIALLDHFGTRKADEHLARMVEDIIYRLGLQYISVKRVPDGRFYVVSEHIINP